MLLTRSMCRYKGFEFGGGRRGSKVVGWRLRHVGERQTVFIWLLQFICLKTSVGQILIQTSFHCSYVLQNLSEQNVYSAFTEFALKSKVCWSPLLLTLSISTFYISVSVHQKSVIYNKPTRCNSGSIVSVNNYRYALHVSIALCVHHQEHYKL